MDGVRMAVISNRLDAVVAGMMNTIFRTGRSGVLNSAHDFSCCVLSAGHELVMGAESLPIHMMSGPDLIARAVVEAHPELRRGDAYLHNNPYNGNSHPADHSMFVPVIDDEGRHRFSVLAKAHQADCGNSQPTTYMAAAADVYEEGALLFDACRVQQDYADNDDVLRLLKLRIRVPEQWWGDYLALLGAVRVGERRMLELGRELGWGELETFVADWFDYSEDVMGRVISELPSGSVESISRHDTFPGAPDGVDVKAGIEVQSDQGRIVVDLRDNVDCMPNGLNLTESTARTAAMVGVFNSIGAGVPPNAGSFRRIEVLLRENCACGIPRHPRAARRRRQTSPTARRTPCSEGCPSSATASASQRSAASSRPPRALSPAATRATGTSRSSIRSSWSSPAGRARRGPTAGSRSSTRAAQACSGATRSRSRSCGTR